MKKIFAPDLMFNDHVKGVWSSNIKKDEDGLIPIQKDLKQNGTYAIQIEPEKVKNLDYWAIGFPLNKLWKNESLNEFSEPKLYFDAVCSTPITISIQFQSEGGQQSQKITIDNTEGWETKQVSIPSSLNKQVKLVVISGPMTDLIFLLSNIYIK